MDYGRANRCARLGAPTGMAMPRLMKTCRTWHSPAPRPGLSPTPVPVDRMAPRAPKSGRRRTMRSIGFPRKAPRKIPAPDSGVLGTGISRRRTPISAGMHCTTHSSTIPPRCGQRSFSWGEKERATTRSALTWPSWMLSPPSYTTAIPRRSRSRPPPRGSASPAATCRAPPWAPGTGNSSPSRSATPPTALSGN